MPDGDGQASLAEVAEEEPGVAAVDGGPSSSGRVRSGSFTALLRQIAEAPEGDFGAGWTGSLVAGATVGRFEMVRELGRGGFGVVWEARDQKLGRSIAFKAVRAGARARLREERLLREAEAAARLSHPNIVTIHDVGQAEQGPYLVLELLQGETLAERLARGPLPAREAVGVAVEIAKGVVHAHERGVVHRDLKPANVFLCGDGRVKVLDFGMAHAFGQPREAGGTPDYMAPEQWAGAPEDERTDLFTLGTMLFEMISGRLPFPDDDRGEAVRSPAPAPPLAVPGAPALGALVARMLEKNPADRPAGAAEVLSALSEIRRTIEAAADPGDRARRRSPWRLAVPIAAGILLGAAVTVTALRGRSPDGLGVDGRALVAVADFANETQDPDLDGLSGLLITSLEQSKSFRVLTRGRMIDLAREMGQGEAPRIDESLARAVGKKAGVQTLILASIRKLGDTYAAELRALEPGKDEYVFTLREQAAAKNDLLPLIDRISERARLALREPEAEVKGAEVKVGEAVTENLEAYRHYFRGKELAARGALREAVGELKRAVEIDPGFALARVDIAWIGYMTSETRADARSVIREAARIAEHAPAKEAGLLRVLEAFFDGRFAACRAAILPLVSRYPDDRDVSVLAAQVLFWSGYVEDAVRQFERAFALAPDFDLLRFDQSAALATIGRPTQARRVADEAANTRRTPTARAASGVARLLAGDLEGGIAALRSANADPGLARLFLAEALAARGDVDEALALVDRLQNPYGDTTRSQIFAYSGRLRDGVAMFEAASRRPGADASQIRRNLARYLAAAGDPVRARAAAVQGDIFEIQDGVMLASIDDERHLGRLLAELGAGEHFNARFLRALSSYRAGDRKAALATFRALDKDTVSFVPYFHGLAAAEAGLDEEALQALRRFEKPVFVGGDGHEAPWLLARARFLEARSLDRLGRRDEARRVLDLQLARWRNADLDLPLLAEMKALRTALATDAPAR